MISKHLKKFYDWKSVRIFLNVYVLKILSDLMHNWKCVAISISSSNAQGPFIEDLNKVVVWRYCRLINRYVHIWILCL